MVLQAEGRDTRGQGNASATVTATLAPDGAGTVVDIDTDLNITGKVAQFGRGVMADVSSKLLGQFAENLERDVLSAATSPAAESPAPQRRGDGGRHGTAPTERGAGDEPGVAEDRRARKPEPIDLIDAAGGAVAKRIGADRRRRWSCCSRSGARRPSSGASAAKVRPPTDGLTRS